MTTDTFAWASVSLTPEALWDEVDRVLPRLVDDFGLTVVPEVRWFVAEDELHERWIARHGEAYWERLTTDEPVNAWLAFDPCPVIWLHVGVQPSQVASLLEGLLRPLRHPVEVSDVDAQFALLVDQIQQEEIRDGIDEEINDDDHS